MLKFFKKHIIEIISIFLLIAIATTMFIIVMINCNKTEKMIADNNENITTTDNNDAEVHFIINNKNKETNKTLTEINYSDIKKINDEYFIVVIVKKNCPSCDRFKKNLEEFILKSDISVYLVDFEKIDEENKEKYKFVPSYEFYYQGKEFYFDYGNIDSDILYKNFIEKLEEK